MKIHFILLLLCCYGRLEAQDNNSSCKVTMETISAYYSGGCKKGYASGMGEAKGIHSYKGEFKFGMPNGNGTYYYTDSIWYSGSFQDGIREGKGEMFYKLINGTDSIISGYWSGDEYRGKKYTTYRFFDNSYFDLVDISPSSKSGNKLSISISTTSGSPSGTPVNIRNGTGYVVTITELVSMDTDGKFVTKTGGFDSPNKAVVTYEITRFPIRLQGRLSNGRLFDLDLYKKADWTIRLNVNK